MSALHQRDVEHRLVVALAIHTDRVLAQVDAFLNGVGHDWLMADDAVRAQALIADYDNPQARAEVHRFLMLGQGPVAVLALSDPGLPGAVWVPKPVRDQALLAAAQAMLSRVQRRTAQAAVAVDRPNLRLLPPPVPRVPNLPSSARTQPLGRVLRGPFAKGRPSDWTSRIGGLTLGALLIVAAVTGLGWQPADDSRVPGRPGGHSASSEPSSSDRADVRADERSDRRPREAVDEARRARPIHTTAQQARIGQDLVARDASVETSGVD